MNTTDMHRLYSLGCDGDNDALREWMTHAQRQGLIQLAGMIEDHAFTGKVLSDVIITPTKEDLIFSFSDDSIGLVSCQGDCCNEVWFEHIEGAHDALGGRIMAVLRRQDWTETPSTRQECEELLRLEIMTTKGCVDLEVRNSSNGYYAGSVAWDVLDPLADVDAIYGKLRQCEDQRAVYDIWRKLRNLSGRASHFWC